MARPALPLLLPALLLLGCGGEPEARPEITNLERAVDLALTAFDDTPNAAKPYRLVRAERMVLDGRWFWRITLKPEHLLPADPATGLIGAGGEVFVNVDEATGSATVRYGE